MHMARIFTHPSRVFQHAESLYAHSLHKVMKRTIVPRLHGVSLHSLVKQRN